MATRIIRKGKDPALRGKCREVNVFDTRLHALLNDMAETMHASNGLGLAAPQVGVLRRVCIIEVGEELIELINPTVTESSEEVIDDVEGCLSFPEEYGMVVRPRFVTVSAQDRFGDLITVTGEGLKARALCHEIDHLNAVLFIDLVSVMIDKDE